MREDVDERDEEDGFEAGDRIGDAAIEVNPGLTLDALQWTGTVVFIAMDTQSKLPIESFPPFHQQHCHFIIFLFKKIV